MFKEADSVDIDGVLVERQIPIQANAMKARQRVGVAMYDRQLVIPQIKRSVEQGQFKSLKEAISFCIHSKRGVRKGVVERLNQRSTHKFGNTGRSNNQLWVEMTWAQLNSSGLEGLEDIFFTPQEYKSVISKGAGIKELLFRYNHVTHFDDDPQTIILLAKHFPEVDFVLVEDASAEYLLQGVDLSQLKNLRRVKQVGEI